MMYMPGNRSGTEIGYLAGLYPGRLGHLFSPGGQIEDKKKAESEKKNKGPSARGPWPFLPYVLDNGAFPAWENGTPWSEAAWRELLAWAVESCQAPMWALVPDVVADRDGTLRAWDKYAPELAKKGWPLAFAAQDGMTFADVPKEAAVVFIGGSDEFKAAALFPWAAHFPSVHVGRVNSYEHLCQCEAAGVASCDGTGFFKGGDERKEGLLLWLKNYHKGPPTDQQTSWLSGRSSAQTARGLKSSTTGALALTGEGKP